MGLELGGNYNIVPVRDRGPELLGRKYKTLVGRNIIPSGCLYKKKNNDDKEASNLVGLLMCSQTEVLSTYVFC